MLFGRVGKQMKITSNEKDYDEYRKSQICWGKSRGLVE